MTNNSIPGSARNQPVYNRDDACACGCGEEAAISASERDLIKDSTGDVLITLGTMFANTPTFRTILNGDTANLLVSIGRKLKRK